MRVDFKAILNNKKRIAIIAGVLIIVLLLFFSDYGLVKRFSLQIQASKWQEEIDAQKHIADSIKAKISKLQNDTLEIERIAREKYGMKKAGETVYYIKEKK